MTDKKPVVPMKLTRTPKPKTAAERMEAIQSGDTKPKNSPELAKLATVPTMYRLTERARNLVKLAVNAEVAEGKRATLGGKAEEAIIAYYGHLESE